MATCEVRGSQWKWVEVCTVVCGSQRESMEAAGSRWKLLKVYGKCASAWKLMEVLHVSGHFMEVLWEPRVLQVYETHGSRLKYIGVSMWKLVEGFAEYSRGSCS